MNRRVAMRKAMGWCIGLLFVMLLPSSLVTGADHNEAPTVMGEEGSFFDFTDIFAFKSPEDATKLVLVIGIFSPEVAMTPPLFSSTGRYEFYIDTNGDLDPETTIRITFDDADGGGQEFTMEGVPQAGTIEGEVTPGSDPIVVSEGDVRAFAGLRDDHFFFDSVGFRSFVANPCVPTAGLRCPGEGAPENFFGSFNTATIVVEFPITALPGISAANSGNLAIWAKTFRRDDS